jgi:hypothetical protein
VVMLKSLLFIGVISLFFLIVGSYRAVAHYPPSCGQTDCGIIQGGTFYSEYYTPGNPNGTPVSAGGGTWIRTSNSPCNTIKYGQPQVTYTLYPHKFTCNVPLDNNSAMLMFGVGILGFFTLKRRMLALS